MQEGFGQNDDQGDGERQSNGSKRISGSRSKRRRREFGYVSGQSDMHDNRFRVPLLNGYQGNNRPRQDQQYPRMMMPYHPYSSGPPAMYYPQPFRAAIPPAQGPFPYPVRGLFNGFMQNNFNGYLNNQLASQQPINAGVRMDGNRSIPSNYEDRFTSNSVSRSLNEGITLTTRPTTNISQNLFTESSLINGSSSSEKGQQYKSDSEESSNEDDSSPSSAAEPKRTESKVTRPKHSHPGKTKEQVKADGSCYLGVKWHKPTKKYVTADNESFDEELSAAIAVDKKFLIGSSTVDMSSCNFQTQLERDLAKSIVEHSHRKEPRERECLLPFPYVQFRSDELFRYGVPKDKNGYPNSVECILKNILRAHGQRDLESSSDSSLVTSANSA